MNERTERPTQLAKLLDRAARDRIEAQASEASRALISTASKAESCAAADRELSRELRDLDRELTIAPQVSRAVDDLARAAATASRLATMALSLESAIHDPESDRAREYWRATSISHESAHAWRLYALAQAIAARDAALDAIDGVAEYHASAIRFSIEAIDRYGDRFDGSLIYALARVGSLAQLPSAERLRATIAADKLDDRMRKRARVRFAGFDDARDAAVELLRANDGALAIGIALDAIPIGSGDMKARGSSARIALSTILDEGTSI
jgi:hypothetical protein